MHTFCFWGKWSSQISTLVVWRRMLWSSRIHNHKNETSKHLKFIYLLGTVDGVCCEWTNYTSWNPFKCESQHSITAKTQANEHQGFFRPKIKHQARNGWLANQGPGCSTILSKVTEWASQEVSWTKPALKDSKLYCSTLPYCSAWGDGLVKRQASQLPDPKCQSQKLQGPFRENKPSNLEFFTKGQLQGLTIMLVLYKTRGTTLSLSIL